MRKPISAWGLWERLGFGRSCKRKRCGGRAVRNLRFEPLEEKALLAVVSVDSNVYMSEGGSATLNFYRDSTAGDLTVFFSTMNSTAESDDYYLMPDYSVTFYDGFSSASTYIYSNYDPDGDNEEFFVYLSYGTDYTPDPYYSSASVSISDPDAAVSPPFVWFDSNVGVDEGYGTEVLLRRDSTLGEVTVSFNAADVTAEVGDYYFMSTGGTTGWATFWDGYDTASDWLFTSDDADGDDEQLSIDLVPTPDYYIMGGTWATIEDHEPPVATNNDYFAPEDTAVMGNVLTDDTGNGVDFDPNGDPLSVDPYPMGTPYFGTVTLAADGSFTYTPTANYCGYDSFGYYVWDNEGGYAYGTVTVTMNPVNDLPEAYGADYMTSEDMISYGSIMYYDVDGDSLTVSIATGGQPQHGGVQFTDYGSYSGFEYTPEENFHGTDSFTYKVTDPSFATATATVQLTVTPINDDPVAAADTVFTEMGQSVTIGDLLLNDTDVDGDLLMISGVDPYSANMGTITDNGDGSVAYTPPLDFTGSDSFTYYVTDNMGGYAMATVSVTIVDGPMVWMDMQPVTIAESGSAPITLHRNRSEGDLMVTLYAYGMSAEPEDYWVGGTAWFADGETEVDIWAMINDDADPDDEIFYIGILNADTYAIDWNQYQVEVTIEDDDVEQIVWFDESMAVTIAENDSFLLPLYRNTTEGELTVDLQVVNYSAEDEDYTILTTESPTFAEGESMTMLSIVVNDDADSNYEDLAIELLEPDNQRYVGGGATFWVMIEDAASANGGNGQSSTPPPTDTPPDDSAANQDDSNDEGTDNEYKEYSVEYVVPIRFERYREHIFNVPGNLTVWQENWTLKHQLGITVDSYGDVVETFLSPPQATMEGKEWDRDENGIDQPGVREYTGVDDRYSYVNLIKSQTAGAVCEGGHQGVLFAVQDLVRDSEEAGNWNLDVMVDVFGVDTGVNIDSEGNTTISVAGIGLKTESGLIEGTGVMERHFRIVKICGSSDGITVTKYKKELWQFDEVPQRTLSTWPRSTWHKMGHKVDDKPKWQVKDVNSGQVLSQGHSGEAGNITINGRPLNQIVPNASP